MFTGQLPKNNLEMIPKSKYDFEKLGQKYLPFFDL